MQTRWHSCDSDQAWLAAALAFVALAEREALRTRGEFHIVLAGGDTPKALYEALSREEHDWARWQAWLGDERCLPAGHAQRNSVMARAALPGQFAALHVIPGELGACAAATAYARALANAPTFDLVLLGLGEDGHTASLFPGCNHEESADVVAVFDAPKPPPERVSLSARRLSRARQVLFLVGGAGKRDALLRWRAGVADSAPLPAATIQPEAGVDVLLGPSLTGVLP